MSIGYLAGGFIWGASLIIAIGAQNAFVLRQGLMGAHVLPVVLFCAISDATLILAGALGLGGLIEGSRHGLRIIAALGAAFLFWYGTKALIRARNGTSVLEASTEAETQSLQAALRQCAVFTWGNPHVYLDTVLLLGGLSAALAGADKAFFVTGAITSSFAWFFALGFGARLLVPLFRKRFTWVIFDLLIAVVMFWIAWTLFWIALMAG